MSEPALGRLSQHEIVGHAAMSAVRAHIQTHLDNALPVAGLAAVAGLSPFHFARKFKAMVGMPPHSYVTKMRMERACLLLAETDVPLREIARNLGDMYLLGIYFHEVFMKTVIARGLPPRFQGAPLSPQEKRCLLYSAHGYTSRYIASALGISERTVELHFSHLRSKLDVANRQEAVAKAIAEGIIRREELPGERSAIVERTPPARSKVHGNGHRRPSAATYRR